MGLLPSNRWIIALLAIVVGCRSTLEPAATPLEVSVHLERTSAVVGDPIIMDASVRNVSDAGIEIPGSPFLVEIRNANGDQVAFGQFQVPLVALPDRWIAPGEVIAELAQWTGEATVAGGEVTPGRYTVRMGVSLIRNRHLVYSAPAELRLRAPGDAPAP